MGSSTRYLISRLWTLAAALTAVAVGVAACGGNGTDTGGNNDNSKPSGLPACGSSTLLTTSPVPIGGIREIAPLGNLNPPGHTFPTDHIYLYFPQTPEGSEATPVSSPGTIRMYSVALQKRLATSTLPEFDDYTMSFWVCTDVAMYFAHVTTLSPQFQTAIGADFPDCHPPYSTGGSSFQQCYKNVDVTLNPGDPIGTAGGPGQGALDLGASDDRVTLAFVDPGRTTGQGGVHAVCPLDYFTAEAQAQLDTLLAVNGNHRTVAPICGTVNQDIAGTAQGRWFFDTTSTEDHHLALVHTNWDPTVGIFSIGTTLPGSSPGWFIFTPAQTGRVNLDFNLVTADGMIYCYQQAPYPANIMHIQLETPSRLRIQYNPRPLCGDPSTWTFDSTSVTYVR